MIDANQEHGIVGPRPGSHSGLPPLKVGDLVRILPNHACATAGQHDAYRVVNESAAAVTAVWQRIRGW
jgi:D-serine deaminase-like pyridoxal phosphate-dependent protein